MPSREEHLLTRERQPIYNRGNEVPVTVVGIIAAIFLAAGLLPPYGEIWKRRGRVIGINWVSQTQDLSGESLLTVCWQIFLAMDWSGAFFSLLALGKLNPLTPLTPGPLLNKSSSCPEHFRCSGRCSLHHLVSSHDPDSTSPRLTPWTF